MSVILAIETATRLCSVAVARQGQVLALREVESLRHEHAEKVNVFIAEVMHEAGLGLNELDAVAVGIGPGSYTGLRIGLSAAKGLCYALDIPILGIGTLGTMARAVIDASGTGHLTVQPMIDARRMEVFTAAYDGNGRALGPHHPLVLDEAWAAQAKHLLVCGDGADKAADLWAKAPGILHLPGGRPTAAAMFAEAEQRMAARAFDDLAYLVPDYGKGANVTQPGKK